MKIALLHYSCPPVVGGVESVLSQHARLFVRAGHEVTVLAGRGETFDERIPVRVLPLLGSRDPAVLTVKSALDRGEVPPTFNPLSAEIGELLLDELVGFDLLIAHNIASLHKNLPLTAALHDAYRVNGFPRLILWHHDLAWTTPRYQPELYPDYPWELLRAPWEGALHVTVSALRREELSGLLGIPGDTIRVVPNGLNVEAFFKLEEQTVQLAEALQLNLADPLLLLPARLTPRKNIELALEVLVELRQLYPKVMLLVTGPVGAHNPANEAYKEVLLALRDELGLQGAAHFMAELSPDSLPDEVIADLYKLAEALFFPSLEEGFGIPLLEAGLSSMPVFCTNLPVLRELGGEDVSYFEPDTDPAAIARQIYERLEGEATSRLARRARHAFNWDSIFATQIAPLLQEAVR